MSSRRPDLEGTINAPPTTSEVSAGPEWSHGVLGCLFFPLLLVFRPMLLVMGLIGLNAHPERKMTITTIRITRSDGRIFNARLEGDLMGAGVNLGDDVSLWGSNRSGTLIVKRGYNHTTSSEIQVRPPAGPIFARIVATIVLLILVWVVLTIVFSGH